MAQPIRPSANPHSEDAAKEELAQQTGTALEEVARIYEQELSELASQATVTQFLGVLASRRARMKLRKH